MPITERLAALISETPSREIPSDGRAAARRAILDTVGVALAGAEAECVRILRSVAVPSDPDGRGQATLLGIAGRTDPLSAALINGTAAHALDYDDTHQSLRGHPSASIVPATLAAAELIGAPGSAVVDAYAIGLEVAGRIGQGIGSSHASQGFHSSSTLGVIGAAAAAARILGLDRRQAMTALGIAASSAAGLRLNFGYMTKPLHAGNAARAGLLAARLAANGFTATDRAFDGPNGFIGTYSPGDGDPAALWPDQAGWQAVVPGIAVKKYPCCNRGHRAVDATLALVERHRFGPPDVERIDVHMPAGQVDSTGRVGPMAFPRPTTGLQAKFSMQYVVAASVADGHLRATSFLDESVHRPVVRALLERVRPVSDDDRPSTNPELDFVRVDVTLLTGEVLSETVRFARGDPRSGDPLSDAEIAAKFCECAEAVLGEERTRAALHALEAIDELADIGSLTELLRSPGAGDGGRQNAGPPDLDGSGGLL